METGHPRKSSMQDSTGPLCSKMLKHLCNTVIGARELVASQEEKKCPKCGTKLAKYFMCEESIAWARSLALKANKFILVAVNFVSTWVKAQAFPSYDARVVVRFLKKPVLPVQDT